MKKLEKIVKSKLKSMPLDSCKYCKFFERVADEKTYKLKDTYCCYDKKTYRKLTKKETKSVFERIGTGNRYLPSWCPLPDYKDGEG